MRPYAWWGYQLTKTVQDGGPHAISEILYVKCAFSHKWVIPKYHLCYLNELTFTGNLYSFVELLNYFVCSFHIIFNDNK